jgi:tetratricopeptide (TPR) repeat protein
LDYQQLRDEVLTAFRQGNLQQGYSLLDEGLATAQGECQGKILVLRASMISSFDLKLTAEGLALIDEALPLVHRNLSEMAMALKVALALTYLSGDMDRALPYEEAACRLLLEHGSCPEVRAERYGLQLNMGLIASLRGDHATSYWYLVQAANSLSVPEVSDDRRQRFEFQIQTQIAVACLRVRRYFEAQEALDQADACGRNHPQRLRAPIYRSELLRQLGQPAEAKAMLVAIRDEVGTLGNADIQAWYYWVSALVAQDLNELAEYHRNLAIAQQLAAEHHFDYLLGEIQRFNRRVYSL